MKRRFSSFDLTPLLDVILILLFLALMVNTGIMLDNRTDFEESEGQRIAVEQELAEVSIDLIDALERLNTLSDWDNERDRLLFEMGELVDWKTATEQTIHFIYIDYPSDFEPLAIHVTSGGDRLRDISVLWATEGNVILNRDVIGNELSSALQTIIESRSDA